MKILCTVAIATLTVTVMPSIVVAQTNTTPPKPSTEEILKGFKPAPVIHAVIPTEMGCHVETAPGKLTKVDCLSPEEIAKYPPPAPCTRADGDAACGMQSITPNNPNNPNNATKDIVKREKIEKIERKELKEFKEKPEKFEVKEKPEKIEEIEKIATRKTNLRNRP